MRTFIRAKQFEIVKHLLLPGLWMCLAASLNSGCGDAPKNGTFARAENGRILIDGKPCYFLGTNLWYAPILASTGEGGNRPRLARELDSLAACGVTNLRVLVGAEGDAGVTAKIEPILQYAPGQYDDRLLDGLDYLLAQLGQRGMKAVLYLNNSWEWSGGYSQYLAWSGEGKAPIPCIDGYETYTDYVARFIPNMRARELFENHVRFIVGRTNRYTGLKYTEDPAIFSWQICNEPRPFGTANHEAFAEWIAQTARLIRSLDPNHMISTGSEGFYGCESNLELTERIHAIPEIAYVNLHIWPSNWRWVDRNALAEGLENAKEMTRKYIDMHLEIGRRLNKPVIIEEFGFPRDSFQFARNTPTTLRDAYYSEILDRLVESKRSGGILAGANFWAWGGEARPEHLYWERGDDYCGDPAQEQQGLYSVFNDDSTVELIRHTNQLLEQ